MNKAPAIRQELPIKSFVVCAYICRIHNGADEYLVLKRATSYMHNTFGQVAGKIEKGESAVEAIVREIMEETGLIPDRLYSADIVETFYELTSNSIIMVPVFVAFVEPEAHVKISYEHSEFNWIKYSEIDDFFPFPPQKSSIQTIHDEFITRSPSELLRIDLSKYSK
jgi:dATP pyrophosphohydrolase